MSETKTTKDALEIIEKQIGDDAELKEMIERETVNACVAQIIYDARTTAGLSQRELARLARISQSTIARLEDADYAGHSLSMLTRIATVLGKRVKIDLVDHNSGFELAKG
jgi:ribosome-binding protein aMBF1 (putative translation factor)